MDKTRKKNAIKDVFKLIGQQESDKRVRELQEFIRLNPQCLTNHRTIRNVKVSAFEKVLYAKQLKFASVFVKAGVDLLAQSELLRSPETHSTSHMRSLSMQLEQ